MTERRPEVPSGRRTIPEIGTIPPPGALAFGPFVLDPETGRLTDGDRVVPLAPKPFETLQYLAHRPGRVIPKAELMEKLWPSTFVTDDVLVQSVVDIRRALGDTAKDPRYIETIPRRGYRFLSDVRAVADPAPAPPAEASPASAVPAALPRAAPPSAARVLLRALLAAAAVAIVLGGYAWWRTRPQSGVAEAMEPGSLVVLPVSVEEPSPQNGWLRQGVAEMIRSQLGQTPGVHVLARHRVASALAEAGYDEERPLSSDLAAGVARRLRAERLVTGSFVRVEDRFVLSAQLVDVATGHVEGTASVRGRHPGDLLEAVDALCLTLLNQLRTTEGAAGRWRPTRLSTRSVDASREYVEALADFARGGRQGAEAAEARLDAALRLDPTFAQAYVKKAEILQWRRQWGYGDPDPAPAVLAAARLVKELPDRERLLVESFEALIVQRQPALALKHWNALLQFYPTYAQEVGIPGLVADTFMNQGRWDDLIMVGEAHVDSPSLPDAERARLCSLLAQAFGQKGEYDRALQYARRAVSSWPTKEGPRYLSQRTTLGRVSLEAGRREEARAEFAAVRDAPDADATNLTQAAWGSYMAGERAQAEAVVQRAIQMDPAYGNAYHLLGWLRLARGDFAGAAENLQRAFDRTPRAFGSPHQGLVSGDLAAQYYAGVAWLKAGRRDRATEAFRALVTHCRRLQEARESAGVAADWQLANFVARASARMGRPVADPPRLEGDDNTYFVQTARLHAVEGRREEALRELAKGIALGHGEYPHLQDDPDFEPLRADPEWKRLVLDHLPAGS